MNAPYVLGTSIPKAEWRELRNEMIFKHGKWDLQTGDHCTLADFPLLIPSSEWSKLAKAAEALSQELLDAESEILSRPELHKVLGLPRAIRSVLSADGQRMESDRVVRFDFHFTTEGWKITEANTDVPGGFLEGSALSLVMSRNNCGEPVPDPAAIYARAIAKRLPQSGLVALVHATAFTDDRQVMLYLGRKLAALGIRSTLVSPEHLRWRSGDAYIPSSWGGDRVDGILRFFPAEWLPRLRNKDWQFFFRSAKIPVNNPATALLSQSKRFPLVWKELDCPLSAWKQFLPYTCDPRAGSRSRQWILKPAFGRVGEDVVMAGVSSTRSQRRMQWAAFICARQWVKQERFTAVPSFKDGGEYYPSLGVFTVNGKCAGAYGRVARKPLIDCEAQDIAVLVQREAA